MHLKHDVLYPVLFSLGLVCYLVDWGDRQKMKGYAHFSHCPHFCTQFCLDIKAFSHYAVYLAFFFPIIVYLMSKMKTRTFKSQLYALCLYMAKSSTSNAWNLNTPKIEELQVPNHNPVSWAKLLLPLDNKGTQACYLYSQLESSHSF